MLNLEGVKKRHLRYVIGKIFVDWWHNSIFYRKVVVSGTENIPSEKPILIGPNHQNALMDALAILCTRNDSPVFLTRSDIFKPDFLGNLFVLFKMLPVYRIRDGKDKLALNEKIFNISVEILEDANTLVVFPEAQHTPYRSLLKLKKGLMRIAFATAEKNAFEEDLHIIPTGIYYSNYFKYRTLLLVQYGEPIRIKDYEQLYRENPQSALFKLRNDLRDKMIPLAIHIEHKDFYDEYENARFYFDGFVANKLELDVQEPLDKFKIDKEIISVLDNVYDNEFENFQNFASKLRDYSSVLSKAKLKDYLFEKPWTLFKTMIVSIFEIALLPIFLILYLNFLIPVCLPELLVRSFKDAQFHSSVRFVVSFFLVQIWGLIIGILLWLVFKQWWLGVLFFVVHPFLFVFWLEYMRISRKIFGHWRFYFNKKIRNKIKSLRDGLQDEFAKFFQKYKNRK
jgi:1-acyl-sn-glycerol-3-phosphate acyltransferase